MNVVYNESGILIFFFEIVTWYDMHLSNLFLEGNFQCHSVSSIPMDGKSSACIVFTDEFEQFLVACRMVFIH